jgi:hypothetical protein
MTSEDKPKIPWMRHDPVNAHLYLLDGDIHGLTPGHDFHGSVEAFRVKVHGMTRRRGLKYRSRYVDGKLWIEVYRNTPGDVFRDHYGDGDDADDVSFDPGFVTGPPAP